MHIPVAVLLVASSLRSVRSLVCSLGLACGSHTAMQLAGRLQGGWWGVPEAIPGAPLWARLTALALTALVRPLVSPI